MLKSFCVDLQHGLQTSGSGLNLSGPGFGRERTIFSFGHQAPSNFQQFCRENGDTPWAGQEHCSGALFPNLSYF